MVAVLFSKSTSCQIKYGRKAEMLISLQHIKSLGNHLGLIFWVETTWLKITKCVQASEIGEYEEEAHITYAILDAVNGNTEDAMTAFESIKNVVSYWNLALVSRCGTWIKSFFILKVWLFHKSILCVDFSQKSRRHWKRCPFSWRTRRMQKLSEKDEGLPNKDFRWQWFRFFSQESKLQVDCSFLLLTIWW